AGQPVLGQEAPERRGERGIVEGRRGLLDRSGLVRRQAGGGGGAGRGRGRGGARTGPWPGRERDGRPARTAATARTDRGGAGGRRGSRRHAAEARRATGRCGL